VCAELPRDTFREKQSRGNAPPKVKTLGRRQFLPQFEL